MKRIEIPGVGLVDFPDNMSDEQIVQAIKAGLQKGSTAPAPGPSPQAAKSPDGFPWDPPAQPGSDQGKRRLTPQEAKALGLPPTPGQGSDGFVPDPDGFVADPPQVSKTASAVRGALQGATLGFSDEIAGAANAVKLLKVPKDVRTPGPRTLSKIYPGMPYPAAASRWFNENRPDLASVAAAEEARKGQEAAYRVERNAERVRNSEAAEANPITYGASQFVGSIPTMMAGGPGLGGAAGVGALQGAGYSEKDSGAGLLMDTAAGAFGGAAGYGVAKGLGAGVRAVDRAAGRKLSAAATKAAEMAQAKVDKAVAALRGAYGAARQNESRAIEVLLRAEATGALSPAQAQQLAALKASPEWTATVQNVAQNYMDDLPGMMGTATTAKGAYQTASQNVAQDVAAEQGRLLSTEEMKAQIAARLKRYGPMGVAGAIAGSSLGGPGGALLGGAAGAAVRPMLHAIRRASQHPAVQTAAWTPLQALAQGAQGPLVRIPGTMAARRAGTALAVGMTPADAAAEAAAQAQLDRLLGQDAEAAAQAELDRLLSK